MVPSLTLSRRSLLHATAGAALVSPFAARMPALAQDDAPTVVASFSILADWVQQVAGETVPVISIVPAGGDAHTFDPDPSVVASIADADVVFGIGSGFEPWLADMLDASGTDARLVEITAHLELLDDDQHDDEHGDEDSHDGESHDDHEEEDGHADGDPHIWGDVHNAIRAMEIIRDTLAEIDEANAQTYAANADAYIAELEQLDAHIRERVATIPQENRKLVTTHDTFGYYADAYGFEVIGTALGSLSTESGDPSARDTAMLVEDIRAAGVPAVFTESIVNPALMEAIASEADVELAPTLYSDALGEEGSDGASYIDMMTTNTDIIVTALGGE